MPWLIMHATKRDIQLVRNWINDSPDVAWVIKAGQSGCTYTWQAAAEIDDIAEHEYAIWHMSSGPLNLPSGSAATLDTIIPDPFEGWTQTLDHSNASVPWFGDNLPGPFSLHFQDVGKEQAGSLGRSEFYWAMDRYKSVGKPAHPQAKRWWQQLRRFLSKTTTKLPWPEPSSRYSTFVFPEALKQHHAGGHLDVNP